MMDALDLEQHLLEGNVHRVGPPAVEGAHPPCRVDYETGLVGLAKFPSLAREDDGQLMVIRERAAWVVARALGWTDLVPPTVLRELDGPNGRERASVQAYLGNDAEMLPELSELDKDDVLRAAVFDIVIHAGDRLGNWMGIRPDDGSPLRLRLIDHGHSFEMPGWGLLRSQFVLACEGIRLRPEHVEALRRLTKHDLRTELQVLLGSDPTGRMMERVAKLLQHSTLTRP